MLKMVFKYFLGTFEYTILARVGRDVQEYGQKSIIVASYRVKNSLQQHVG